MRAKFAGHALFSLRGLAPRNHHVVYRATGGLPARAKVLRVVAPDGAEVRAGDVLLELESA